MQLSSLATQAPCLSCDLTVNQETTEALLYSTCDRYMLHRVVPIGGSQHLSSCRPDAVMATTGLLLSYGHNYLSEDLYYL